MVWADPRKLLRAARQYALSIAAWGLLSLVTSWQFPIFGQQLRLRASLRDLFLLAESRGFAFALLTPLVFHLVNRCLQREVRRVPYSSILILAAAPFLVVYSTIRWAVLSPLQLHVPGLTRTPLTLIRADFADTLTVYLAILAAAHAYYYFRRARQQEREKREFETALAASELKSLQRQLHPHFLFNSLHGISTLMDMDRGTAKAMVVKLSNLLRRVLQYGEMDLIALDEELRFAREYLDLERMRLGPRLAVDWVIDPNTQQILVPQLILQPLLENAIRHGVSHLRDGGWIEISACKRESSLELCVRNSIGPRGATGFGVGLRNTQARLRLLYSDDASFTFMEAGGHIATATILLPALGSDLGLPSEVHPQAA